MKTTQYRRSVSLKNSSPTLFSIIGWTIILFLSFYFIYTNALRYFDLSNPVYTPQLKPFAPFLLVHIIGGMVALLIGPLQFFSAILHRYPRMHRNIGKTYLLAIILSGIMAIYLIIFDNLLIKGEFTFGTGTLGLALAWFITAGMALWAIKKRNITQHKEWMIRSYVVTSGFTTFRLITYGLAGIESFPFKNEVGNTAAWAGWAIPLLITEVIIQARKISPARVKQQVHQLV